MLRALGVTTGDAAAAEPLDPEPRVAERLHEVHRQIAGELIREALARNNVQRPTFGDPAWADVALVDIPAGGDLATTIGTFETGPLLVTLALPIAAPAAGFPATDATFPDQAAAATAYADVIAAAATDRRVIGLVLRQWADDPPTGIGPTAGTFTLVTGPTAAAGLVDVGDRLKPTLAAAVRAANDAARAQRNATAN